MRPPWALADAPSDFVEKLIGGIVGIEMPIARLVGKWKTSQNRPEADQRGVIAGLQEVGTAEARLMAEYITQIVE
jgi:transcriptional regulator